MIEKASAAGAKTLPELQALIKGPTLRAAQIATEGFQNVLGAVAGMTPELAQETLGDIIKRAPDIAAAGEAIPHINDLTAMMSTLQTGGTEALVELVGRS